MAQLWEYFHESVLPNQFLSNLWLCYAFVCESWRLTSFQCILYLKQRERSYHSKIVGPRLLSKAMLTKCGPFCECSNIKGKASTNPQSLSVLMLKVSELFHISFIQLISLRNTMAANENELCKNVSYSSSQHLSHKDRETAKQLAAVNQVHTSFTFMMEYRFGGSWLLHKEILTLFGCACVSFTEREFTSPTSPVRLVIFYRNRACVCVWSQGGQFPHPLPPSTWKTGECKEIWAWQDRGTNRWKRGV